MNKLAVVAGAGPAGLTAALELLRRSPIIPIVFEADTQVGGISKTVNYRGNRMDLGGHRFFSKSDWVTRWWEKILPIARDATEVDAALRIAYQGQSHEFAPSAVAPAATDSVMLVRSRLSRILHRGCLFDYPLRLNAHTLRNMGVAETLRVGGSYARARLSPQVPEHSLEDFLVNRFGERLYRTFFKDYTEKVWGVPCTEISAAWGAQRIKGLSVTKALGHALTAPFRSSTDTAQTHTETSLIERFLYPKLGPGQMTGLTVSAVTVRDERTGAHRRIGCDYFLSTLPLSDLAAMLSPEDERVAQVAGRLPYRDFLTVGLLLRRMSVPGKRPREAAANGMPPDNWIYVQEPRVKVGRLQIFNNWSPALVADPDTIWLGLEYFCREGDELWSMRNGQLVEFAAGELAKLDLIERRDVLDGTVYRVPKAYPAYFGEYRHFSIVRDYLDEFHNLFSIGRNGMHRYNNQDHSMYTSMLTVENLLTGSQHDVWSVNVEEEYHEINDQSAASALSVGGTGRDAPVLPKRTSGDLPLSP